MTKGRQQTCRSRGGMVLFFNTSHKEKIKLTEKTTQYQEDYNYALNLNGRERNNPILPEIVNWVVPILLDPLFQRLPADLHSTANVLILTPSQVLVF